MSFSFKQLISELRNENFYNQELESIFIFLFKEFFDEYSKASSYEHVNERARIQEVEDRIRNQVIPLFIRQKAKKRSDSRAIKLDQAGLLSALTKFYFDEGGFVRCKEAMIQRLKEYIPQSNLTFITEHRLLAIADSDELGFENIGISANDVKGFVAMLTEMSCSTEESKWYEAILYAMFASFFPVEYILEEHRDDLKSRVLPLFTHLKYYHPQYFGCMTDTALQRMYPLLISIAHERIALAMPRLERFVNSVYRSTEVQLPPLGCTVKSSSGVVDICDIISPDTKESYMITGSGGCGKTFGLIRLAQRLLDNESYLIPLYIPLNAIAYTGGDSIKAHIITMLAEGSELSQNECRSLFDMWVARNNEWQLLLLLDGFNEINSADMQAAAAGEISRIITDSNVRVVVTSRYDMSSSFVAGSTESRFISYEVKELSSEAVDDFIFSFFDRNDLPEGISESVRCDAVSVDKSEVKSVLRTPMGLIMYCAMRAQGSIAAKRCSTVGELTDSYLSFIKKLNGANDTGYDYSGFIAYVGYLMNDSGVFRLSRIQLLRYAKEYFGEQQYKAKAEGFFANGFVKDVMHFNIGNEFVIDMEFIHQNYRDFFAARYLKGVLCGISAEEINDCFGGSLISAEVLTLLGNIIGEHHCVNGGYSLIQDVLSEIEGISASAVAQLVRTSAAARGGDLSCFDFGGLDLTCTPLNGIKLYRTSEKKASFKNATVSQGTFAAQGHEGAVFAMLYIGERYVLSFAKNGIFCFDMRTKKHFKAAEYQVSPIHAAYHLEGSSHIITGDMDGRITLWQYSDDDEFSLTIVDIVTFENHGDVKIVDSLDLSADICAFAKLGDRLFVGVYGGTLCELCAFDGKYCISDKTIELCHKHSAICMCEGNSAIYAGCGNELFRFSSGEDGSLYTEVFPLPEDWLVKDIAIMRVDSKEHLLVNVRYATHSCVYEISAELFGSAVGFDKIARILCTKEHSCSRRGFRGWKFFSEQAGDIIWLTADIEDSPEQASLLRICASKVCTDDEQMYSFIASECCPCRHTMAINCAIAFDFDNKKYIATGSTDRSVELLSAEGGDVVLLHHLSGHVNGIHSVELVDEGMLIASHYSGEVSVWNKQDDNWNCVKCCKIHNGWVWQSKRVVYGNKAYIISCSYDNTISVIQEDTEEIICRITEPQSRVLSFGMLSDNILLTGYIIGEKSVLQKFYIDYVGRSYKAGTPITINEGEHLDVLRYIAAGDNRLLLCYNNNDIGSIKCIDKNDSTDLDSIRFSAVEVYSKDCNRINIRCVDEIKTSKYLIRAVGGDSHSSFGELSDYISISVCVDGKAFSHDLSQFNSGCSAVKLLEYKNTVYLAAGTYDNRVHILKLHILPEAVVGAVEMTLSVSSKPLSIQYSNGSVYVSTLDGCVYSIDVANMAQTHPTGTLLFRSVSGYSYCHLDLSEVNATDWNCDFKKSLSYYASLS